MPDLLTIVFSVEIITLLIVLFFSFKILRAYRSIDNSFSKLGYIIREDSKKYFDEVGAKILLDKKGAEAENKRIITEALIQAMTSQNSQSSKIIEQTNNDIQQTISQARQTAQDIIKQAEDQAVEINEKVMKKMVLIVEKALTEYVDQNFSEADREKSVMASLEKIDLK